MVASTAPWLCAHGAAAAKHERAQRVQGRRETRWRMGNRLAVARPARPSIQESSSRGAPQVRRGPRRGDRTLGLCACCSSGTRRHSVADGRARCADEEEKKKRVDVSRGAAWHRGTLFSHGSRFAGGQKGIAGRVRGCSLKKYLLAQYGLGQPSEGLDRRSLKKNPGAGTVQQE